PVFSPVMLEWMQDAWLIGSVEYGFSKLRSGMLFSRLVNQPMKYSMSGIGSLLEGISKDDLKANLQKILSGSKEDAEASSMGAGGGAAPGGGLGGKASANPDSALAKYTVDYTGKARAGEIDPIFGREREIRQ